MGIHRRREMHTAVNGGGIVFEYSGIYDALYFVFLDCPVLYLLIMCLVFL